MAPEVLNLAYPVIFGMLGWTVQTLVDTWMVGKLGPSALAATGLGGVIAWTVGSALSGAGVATQTLTARRYGEGRLPVCGSILDHSVLLAILFSVPICSAGVAGSEALMKLFAPDADVLAQGTDYVRWRFVGLVGATVIFASRGFFAGVGRTRVHLIVAAFTTVINVCLNYVLIFGKLGFPRMGVEGAGLATAISSLCGAGLFVSMALRPVVRRRFDSIRLRSFDRSLVRALIRLGIPAGIRSSLVMASYTVFTKIVSELGTKSLAANSIVWNIASVAFMPAVGFGIASAALVGQRLGAKQPEKAEQIARQAIRLSGAVTCLVGLAFLLFPRQLVELFIHDPDVVRMGIPVMMLLGLVEMFDGIALVLGYSLEGAGLVKWVMIFDGLIHWGLMVPLTYIVTLRLGFGLTGAWSVILFLLVIQTLTFAWKFKQGSWKRVVV